MTSKDKPWRNCSIFGYLLILCIVLTLALMYNVGSRRTTKAKKTAIHLRQQLNSNLQIANYLQPNISLKNHLNLESAIDNQLKSNFTTESILKQSMSILSHFHIVDNQHFKQNSTNREKKLFYRPDTTPENTIRLPFLENFKNPCWRERVGNFTVSISQLRCLPYFYIVGAPKAGTSDLHSRLILHPSVSNKVEKEPHWIAHLRFHEKGKNGKLSNYLHYFDHAVKKDILASKQENGRYSTIFGDCSCSTLWDNWNLLNEKMRRNMTFPPYTNANIIYNLNPNAKIIIMLRNPITRLYSDYLSFQKFGSTSQLFYNKVVKAINEHTECLRGNSLRYCVHIGLKKEIRLCVGMYHIYLEDFLRVFPKEQIKIIKTEDFSNNITKTMKDVFEFLEIGDPLEDIWTQIIGQKKTNEGKEKYQQAGEMLPETRRLLSRFYKPYNEKLARVLGDNFMFDQ